MEPRDVVIRPVLNGWCVRVGCTEVVFNEVDELVDQLRDYLMHPTATEKRFVKESVNAALFRQGAAPDQEGQAGPGLSATARARLHGDLPLSVPGPVARPYFPPHLDERLGALERDTDTRLDDLSQRLDAADAARDRMNEQLDILNGRVAANYHSLDQRAETLGTDLATVARRTLDTETAHGLLEDRVDRLGRMRNMARAQRDQLSDRITELEAEVPRWQRVVTESGAEGFPGEVLSDLKPGD